MEEKIQYKKSDFYYDLPEERIAQVADVTRARIVAAAQATALDTVYFMKGAAQ